MLSFYLTLLDDEESKSLFEQIYLSHRHSMVYAADQILHDQMLAEDATHDAFMRILKHLDRISDPKCHKTRGFVVLIVRNIALDYCQKMKRKPEISYDEYKFIFEDDKEDPVKTCEDNEWLEYLHRKVSKLHPNYAEVLTLKYSFEYSDREISQLLAISHDAVRARLYRAKKQLKLEIIEEGVDEFGEHNREEIQIPN